MGPDRGRGREFHAEKNKGKDTEAKHFPQLFQFARNIRCKWLIIIIIIPNIF